MLNVFGHEITYDTVVETSASIALLSKGQGGMPPLSGVSV